jgi:hypothetical protein
MQIAGVDVRKSVVLATVLGILVGLVLLAPRDVVISVANTSLPTEEVTSRENETDNSSSASDTVTITRYVHETVSLAPTGAVSSTAGVEGPALKLASIVLQVPLESDVVEPDKAAQAQSGWQDIMTDGFEGAFPDVWVAYSNTDYTDAYWGRDSYNPHSGSYSAFCAKGGLEGVNPPANYPGNMDAWMAYGPFSLEDATDAELNFWFWQRTEGAGDYVFWGASTTGDWFYGYAYLADSRGWQSESFDLTHAYLLGNLCGESQVWIAFAFTSDIATTGQGAFVDDVVLRKYVGANNPPNMPSSPLPPNHVTGVSVDADLSWTAGDPDPGDTVTHDVYFGTSASLSRVSDDESPCTYDPGTLNGNTRYCWKIVARDNHGAATIGPLWDFTTGLPGATIAWNCPLGGQALIAPNSSAGRPFLTLPAGCAGITASAGADLWGIYWLDESAGVYDYYIPGFVNSTLTQLEPDKYYLVVVSGACTLTIPQ